MILLDVTYKGNDDVVTVLWGRKESFEDTGFLPYIYVIPEGKEKPDMVIEGRKIVRIEEVEMKDLAKKVRAWKIFFRHPKDVGLFRSELKAFGERRELDIPFTRRYMIDRGLMPFGEVNTEAFTSKDTGFFPKILAFDIETLSSSGVQMGADPVIMASFFSDGFEKVIGWGEKIDKAAMVAGEKELITEIAKTIEDFSPDVLVSYNGDGFDWPYLEERARKLKIPFRIGGKEPSFQRRARDNAVRIRGSVNIDIYSFVRNILSPYMQSETLKLDSVAGELLGEGKVKIGGAKGITEAWEKNRKLLYDYSLQDSRLTYLLAREILPMIIELAKVAGQNVFDVSRMTPGQMVEWLLIKEAFKEKMLVPNRPLYSESSERRQVTFEGAFVKEPIRGLHSPIAVCDFRSLYPTIIMGHNISPDTVDCGHSECAKNTSPSGNRFCTRREGFISKTIRGLFEERMRLKHQAKTLPKGSMEQKIIDTRQKALKLLLNSFYGYLGYSNARWYTLESAKATTAWGREYINRIMKEASMHGFTVIYGDTDSVMITSESGTFEADVRNFLDEVNKGLPKPIELELDDFFVRGVFVTKKRYALLGQDGRLVVKGLERVRRDWSELARETQEKVLRLILDNKVEEAKEEVVKIVNDLREKKVNISKLVIRTQLTKLMDSYKQTSPHVKVAADLKRMGREVFPGMLVEYVVTPGRKSISERSVPAETAKDYDPEYYAENQVIPAVERIFEALGGEKPAFSGKQKNLSSFF